MTKIGTFAALAVVAGGIATACAPVTDVTTRSQPVPQMQTLTGQDVGEANGALDALVEEAIVGTGVSIREYLVLRVLSQEPRPSPQAFYEYLVGQRQMKLDMTGAVDTVRGLEGRGLLTGSDPRGSGPVVLTDAGAALSADLAGRTRPIAQQVFGGMDPADLQTAHRVLRDVIGRAQALRGRR